MMQARSALAQLPFVVMQTTGGIVTKRVGLIVSTLSILLLGALVLNRKTEIAFTSLGEAKNSLADRGFYCIGDCADGRCSIGFFVCRAPISWEQTCSINKAKPFGTQWHGKVWVSLNSPLWRSRASVNCGLAKLGQHWRLETPNSSWNSRNHALFTVAVNENGRHFDLVPLTYVRLHGWSRKSLYSATHLHGHRHPARLSLAIGRDLDAGRSSAGVVGRAGVCAVGRICGNMMAKICGEPWHLALRSVRRSLRPFCYCILYGFSTFTRPDGPSFSRGIAAFSACSG